MTIQIMLAMSSETVQVIFSGIVTLSTVVYSILTWQLVQETRRTREFQHTPDVNLFFDYAETDASYRYLVFTNNGLGIARNVRFKILKDFSYYSDRTFSILRLGIIQNGISYFYSGQQLRYLFTDLSKGDYNRAIADPLIIAISYQSVTGKLYNKTVELSLGETHGNSVLTPPDSYVGKIAYEMRGIRQLLESRLPEK